MKRLLNSFFSVFFFLVLSYVFMITLSPQEIGLSSRALAQVQEVEKTLDIILIIDQSSSMSGYSTVPATDPERWRVKAAQYLIQNLSLKVGIHHDPRIGIVQFGTEAPPELSLPLTLLDDENLKRTMDHVEAKDLVWTNFTSAFLEANRLLIEGRTYDQENQTAIIVLTDGRPSDPRSLSEEEYFHEIKQAMGELFLYGRMDLFIIGIDAADMSWKEFSDQWIDLLPTKRSEVFHLKSISDLPRLYNDIIRSLYILPFLEPIMITEDQLVDFDLPAYIDIVEFHFFPDSPELTLKITRPDGTVLSREDEGVEIYEHTSFRIILQRDPQPGVWKYQIEEGYGRVEVYLNLIPFKLTLIQPRPQEPAGKSQEVLIGFTREDGTPIEVLPDYPIELSITVVSPFGESQSWPLEEKEPGIYTIPETFRGEEIGLYEIELMVQATDEFTYTSMYEVDVISTPYLRAITPTEGEQLRAWTTPEIYVAVTFEEEDMDLETTFLEPADRLIIGWLESPEGLRSDTIYFTPTETKGQLKGIVPETLPPGEALLHLQFIGTYHTGEELFVEDLMIPIHVSYPLWFYLAIGGGAILFLGLFLIIIRRKGSKKRELRH